MKDIIMEKAEQILYRIDNRLNAIDSTLENNRKLLIRVVRQSNELFKAFMVMSDIVDGMALSNIDLEKGSENFPPPLYIKEYEDMADAIRDRIEEFQRFEEEMEKFKNELTPGTMGEA
jgi:hypothetical protein